LRGAFDDPPTEASAAGNYHPPGEEEIVIDTRRQFLAKGSVVVGGVLVGGNVLAACGDDDDSGGDEGAAPTKRVNLGMNWGKDVEFAGYYVGIEEGFYADDGVELELISGGPNAPESVQMVASGTANIGISSDLIQIFDTIEKGTPLVMFAAKFQQSPAGLASLPDNPVRTAQDMVGKRIGGPQGDQRFFDTVLAVNGLKPGDYEFVPTGFDPEPLANGDVDALSVFVTNQPLTLEAQGVEVVAVTYAEMGLASYADILYAEQDYIESNRETLVGFLRGTVKGWETQNASPEVGAQLTIDQYGADLGLKLEDEVREAKAMIPLMQSDVTKEKGIFWMSAEELGGPMYEALRASGRENLPPVDEALDLTLIEEAYDGKTSLI
jgi:ABC-type nitrate/sulfonate/bicarbonate transport system substrate-binding protein